MCSRSARLRMIERSWFARIVLIRARYRRWTASAITIGFRWVWYSLSSVVATIRLDAEGAAIERLVYARAAQLFATARISG